MIGIKSIELPKAKESPKNKVSMLLRQDSVSNKETITTDSNQRISPKTVKSFLETKTNVVEQASSIVVNASALARVRYSSGSADGQPCNWHLTDKGDGTISGINNVTGSTFEGTRAEFSEAIRDCDD